MAISAAMWWEARTTGSDTACSGGFRGGAAISAPSAPTVNGSSSGGTVAANTYYVVVTYTDGLGDTVISGQTSVVTTGATSSITVTSPAASTGALTWNCYVGTTSGGPYFPQGTGLTIGSNRSITTTPPTSGTQPRGVDRTLQNGAQVNVENSAITATTAGANSNVLTFTGGYTPSGSDVGNTFRATGGTNIAVGTYEITAVTTTTWTVTGASNLTTAGGAGSAILGVMGGALASPGQVAVSMVAANTFAWKAGTYAAGTGTVNTAGNRVAFGLSNMTVFGYTSNRHPLNTDTPPVFTAGANAQTVFSVNGANVFVSNIKVTNPSNFTTVVGIAFAGNNGIRGRRMVVTDCATSLSVTSGLCHVEDSQFTSGVVVASGNEHYYRRCAFITAPAGPALQLSSNGVADECIFVSPVGVAIDMASPGVVKNCYIHGCGSTTAAITCTSSQLVSIENTIIWSVTGSGGKGIAASGGNTGRGVTVQYCAIGSTSGVGIDSNVAAYQQIGCAVLTVDPATNSAGNDFSLNGASGGGALCRALGIPGTWLGLSTTGYRDIGAAQHQAGSISPLGESVIGSLRAK